MVGVKMDYEKMTKTELIREIKSLKSNVKLAMSKEIEVALQESDEKYHQLVETAFDAIFIANARTGIILFANKRAEELIGIPVEEIVGMHHTQIYPPEDVDRNKKLFKKYAQMGKGITSEDIFVQHNDGRTIPVEISSRVFELGGKNVMQGMFRVSIHKKRIEEKLKESYNLLNSIIKQTNYAIFVKDIKGRYLMINSAGSNFIGKSMEEILGKDDTELFSPDTSRQIVEQDRRIITSGEIQTIEEIATSNGNTRTFLSTKLPYRNHKEDIIGVIGIAHDITERKRVEEELKKIFDLSIDMICIAGIDGYFKKINPSFGKTLGYSNEELLGQPFINFVHPDDKTKTLDVVENELSKGTDVINFENRYRCKNGSYRWFMWTAKPVTNEGIMFGIARDITKLKHDEEELKKHRDHLKALVAERTLELAKVNEKLRLEIVERKNIEKEIRQAKDYSESLINNSIDMIISVNTNRKIVIFNPAAEKIFGYKKEEVLGKHVQILYADSSQSMQVHKTTMNTSEFDGEVLNRKKDGSTFISHLSSTVLRDEKSVTIGFMGISRDITERKQAEEMLRKSEEKYRRLIENLQDNYFFYVHNIEGIFTYVSPSLTNILGYSTEKFLTHYSAYLTDNPINKEVIKHTERSIQGIKQPPYEVEIYHKDGTIRSLQVQETPIFDNNRKVVAVEGIAQDITERKRMEEDLRRTTRQLSIMLESLPIIPYICKTDGNFGATYIGTEVEKVTGFKPEDFTSNDTFWADRIHPDDAPRILANIQTLFEKGYYEHEYRWQVADDSYKWFYDVLRLVKLPDKTTNQIVGIWLDITERKKAEEMLQEQKKALEQKNIALSEILGQIELEKKQIKDNVIANAENLLLPIIQKLRLTGESRKYVQLLRKNLQELTSSFGTRLTEKEAKLTSREVEICNMVKNGLTSKEIANLLNISLGTTERHRNNIRKKLHIVNKDINLSSYLNTL